MSDFPLSYSHWNKVRIFLTSGSLQYTLQVLSEHIRVDVLAIMSIYLRACHIAYTSANLGRENCSNNLIRAVSILPGEKSKYSGNHYKIFFHSLDGGVAPLFLSRR